MLCEIDEQIMTYPIVQNDHQLCKELASNKHTHVLVMGIDGCKMFRYNSEDLIKCQLDRLIFLTKTFSI